MKKLCPLSGLSPPIDNSHPTPLTSPTHHFCESNEVRRRYSTFDYQVTSEPASQHAELQDTYAVFLCSSGNEPTTEK